MPETNYPAPHSVQIELIITVNLLIIDLDCLTGRYIESNTDYSEETLSFDLHLLEDPVQIYEILSPILTRLQINPASSTFDDIIDDIIRQGLNIRNRVPNMGNIVWPLRVEVEGIIENHVYDESVLIRRAMEESALASNHGMVPAEESSVEKMLKRVRLEDGDQCAEGGESDKKAKVKGEACVICLEEFRSDASQMPCSHIFHAVCIQQWLKQSHYCPICRFEMPISETFKN